MRKKPFINRLSSGLNQFIFEILMNRLVMIDYWRNDE